MKAYNAEKRLQEILNYNSTQEAIKSIIQDRIFREGILADGRKLKTDSVRYQSGQMAYSKNNKKKKNLDHVNLYITGDFFDGWQLRVGARITRLYSDKIREIFVNFQDMFTNSNEMIDKIGTLTEEEIEIIKNRIIMPYIEQDIKEILNVQMR